MKRRIALLLIGTMALTLAACGDKPANNGSEGTNAESETIKDDTGEDKELGAKGDADKVESEAENTEIQQGKIVETDLKESEGLEFESNGDGTCTIVGIGTCTDEDIVIPNESPDGESVTLIGENAFYGLDGVNSVTLINSGYEIDEKAFQYSEFKTLNIIGGNPVFGKSAFSTCEDISSISFTDCNIQAGEYSFYSCGKDAEISLSKCSGYIDEKAFQYSDFTTLTIDGCELELDKSAFSTCEALTSIKFSNSTIKADEYAFYKCGDSANVEITDCEILLDEQVFQYSSLSELSIKGTSIEMGKSAFSSCEKLTTVNIDCETIIMGKYAFYKCEDLVNVSIGEKSASTINIDDSAFQYCEDLENVIIGSGELSLGKYIFSGCSDNLSISIDGKNYTADSIKDGISEK